MERSRIAVVIPAFNESATIGRVVAEVTAQGVPLVVDDASTDDTSAAAELAGAVVVRHERNRGYDGALNSGFAAAAERNFDYVVTFDADGQHPANLIGEFAVLLEESAAVVVGVRPSKARLGEWVFGVVFRLRFGLRDPLCGMKGYRLSLYREVGHFDSYGSTGTELLLYAAKRRCVIREVPIPVAPRAGRSRYGLGLSANLRILRSLLRGLLH